MTKEQIEQIYRDSQQQKLPAEIEERSGNATLKRSSLLFLRALAEALKPKVVVEFGSGLSTRLLADYVRQPLQVVSVENSEYFLQGTLRAIREKSKVIACHAPLERYSHRGRWFLTYSPSYLEKIPSPAELVLIDGPLGFFQREAPLHQVLPSLARPAVVLLDDSHRLYEQQTLARWKKRYPDLEIVSFGAEEPITAILIPATLKENTSAWNLAERLESYVRTTRRLFYLWNQRRQENSLKL